jgi:hypothetical protein
MLGRANDTGFGENFRQRCLRWRVSAFSGLFWRGICYLSTRIINSFYANLIRDCRDNPMCFTHDSINIYPIIMSETFLVVSVHPLLVSKIMTLC